eukprot:TRINITY_DN1705_c0_g2_i3.p1 TRINITY_DN1705_c0_g2~~TRINITY_DN1705_c0_g2_i3.p1  ORF type:complete len:162 (-),score=1.91 TRINITY_DN1705_c0_g2_i3:1645-2130(-)
MIRGSTTWFVWSMYHLVGGSGQSKLLSPTAPLFVLPARIALTLHKSSLCTCLVFVVTCTRPLHYNPTDFLCYAPHHLLQATTIHFTTTPILLNNPNLCTQHSHLHISLAPLPGFALALSWFVKRLNRVPLLCTCGHVYTQIHTTSPFVDPPIARPFAVLVP